MMMMILTETYASVGSIAVPYDTAQTRDKSDLAFSHEMAQFCLSRLALSSIILCHLIIRTRSSGSRSSIF